MNGGWGISYENALSWMPLDLIDEKLTLVQVMAWCRQATSHYLSQCLPRSLSPYGVTRPQWVNLSNWFTMHTIPSVCFKYFLVCFYPCRYIVIFWIRVNFPWIFTPWPYGLNRTCHCLRLFVRQSDVRSISPSSDLVCVITYHRFELESPNLHQTCYGCILLTGIENGGHWRWLSTHFKVILAILTQNSKKFDLSAW